MDTEGQEPQKQQDASVGQIADAGVQITKAVETGGASLANVADTARLAQELPAVTKTVAKKAGKGMTIGCMAEIFVFVFVILLATAAANPDAAALEPAASGGIGGVTNGQTTATISASQLKKIKENKPAYIAAADKYKIPWQILAALHSREGGNNQERSGPSGEAPGEVNPDSGKVECTDYTACEVIRAKKLLALAKSYYKVSLSATSTDTDIQRAFLAYNRGSMYVTGKCTPEQSPYVFNNYDKAHYHMTWPDNSCEPASTRGRVNIPNGAYTVYVYLINKGI